jgi:hypothetical protein
MLAPRARRPQGRSPWAGPLAFDRQAGQLISTSKFMKNKVSPFSLGGGCILLLISILVPTPCLFGQPLQREWVMNYSLLQTKINQASAIAVTPDGNIVAAGTSQNAGGDLDYYVVKYKPNGDQAWSARYNSTNSGNDQLRGMTIDPNGNVIVTGTTDTVKFNSAGAFVWSQPLGGRAVIANVEYVYVTGFSEADIATAQLQNDSVDGKELWRRILDGRAHGDDIGQAIGLDGNGNLYVAGQEDYSGCSGVTCHRAFAVVSYTVAGVQRWFGGATTALPAESVQVNSLLVDQNGFAYTYGNYYNFNVPVAAKFDQNGSNVWDHVYGGTFGTRMISDSTTQKIIGTGRTGVNAETGSEAAMMIVLTGTESSVTQPIWKDSYGDFSQGSDLAQDSLGNVYIVGFSGNDPLSRAMLLAKVTTSGQQLGVDRYNSPNAGSNFGTALAIDGNDNVYVAGYVLNTLGGSEFVTIKYSAAPKIEMKPSGAMHIEFHTSPGQQYAIEATTNFFDWQSLITNTADLNGLIHFDDTAVPAIPYRFYRGNAAP